MTGYDCHFREKLHLLLQSVASRLPSHFQLFPVVSSRFQSFPVVSSRIQSYPVVSSRFQSFPVVSSCFQSTSREFLGYTSRVLPMKKQLRNSASSQDPSVSDEGEGDNVGQKLRPNLPPSCVPPKMKKATEGTRPPNLFPTTAAPPTTTAATTSNETAATTTTSNETATTTPTSNERAATTAATTATTTTAAAITTAAIDKSTSS